jgi:hypothetical protein
LKYLPITIIALVFLLVPISVSAFDEPSFMKSTDSLLEEFYYLTEERKELQYSDLPSNYETGVELIRVDEFDRDNGAYQLVFWHWVKIHEKDDPTNFVHDQPSFHYVNADHVDFSEIHVERHYFEQKVMGHFHGPLDFKDFPFERLGLKIIIEPSTHDEIGDEEHLDIEPSHKDTSQVNFVLDPKSGIGPDATVPGFSLGEFFLEKSKHTHEGIEHQVYSRVTATFTIDRSYTGSFFTAILPTLMITGLALLTFFIPQNFTPRIYLTAPLLLALVYLHRAVINEIPDVGYATLFDNIMVINYTVFVIAITSLAIQMRYSVIHNDSQKESKINKTMLLLIPVVVSIEIVVIWILR